MNHRQPYADRVLLAGRFAGPRGPKDAPKGASGSFANAVAVRQGRIAAIGTAREIRAWIGPETEVVDIDDGLILPGFRDALIHPLLGGMNLVECNLTGLVDLEACLAHITSYARANQDKDFIRGGGWLPDLAPRREHLDAMVPDRPVLLKSIDGHNAWVNTRALELAGIIRDTPNPPGGIIERDSHSGEATGILREWTAMELVESRLPTPTTRDRVMAGWAILQRAAGMGIVSVHEAMAYEEELLAYQALGVIANLQPIWFCEEKHFAHTTLVSLGEQRAWSLYPVRDLLDSGAALTCGTDWPFSGELNTFNPLESIQIGVTRRCLDPEQGQTQDVVQAQAYNPAQCVSLTMMLHAHTLGGAYADFQEGITGFISVGKFADLVVLDRDILKVPADEISQANVSLTMFQGKIIHRAPKTQLAP